MKTLLNAAAVMLLCLSVASAATYTVDPAGMGDATTISGALALTSDGDTVIVKDGNYIESVTMSTAVYLLAEDGASPVIQYDGTGTAAGAVVQITDTNDTLVIEGITLNGINGVDTVGTILYFAQWGTAAGYKIFRNCLFTGFDGNGLNIQQNQSFLLEDCEITDGIGYGLYSRIKSGARGTISGCRIHDLTSSSNLSGGVGMYSATNMTIENNVIYNCTGAMHGIWTRNDIDPVIRNNIIFDIAGNGIDQYGAGTNLQIYNNTIYGCTRGIDLISDTLTMVRNNIAWNNTVDLYGSAAGFRPDSVTNNCFATVTNIDTSTGPNITSDPLFVNITAGSYNFALQAGSPCLSAGSDGTDLGAYGGSSPNTATAPLPVTLASFYAEASACAINLYWTTASECDNLGFNVLKCATVDGYYEKINGTLIPGAGTSAGSNSYMYSDGDACEGTSYYRLEQVDVNGTKTLSDPIEVNVQPTALSDLAPVHIARQFGVQNPTDANRMVVSFPEAVNAKVSLYGADGICYGVMADRHFQAGVSSLRWPADMQSGLYVVTIETKYGAIIKKVAVGR